MIIGVDFSIKSPAITLSTSGKELSFLCFPRKSVVKEDTVLSLKAAGVDVNLLEDAAPLPKVKNIAILERSSLNDAIMLNTVIVDKISSIKKKEQQLIVGIEGFSFGSTGNRLAQISGYQWSLRFYLYIKSLMSPANFYTYAPMTVKSTAGKGNYKKEQMIEAFIKSDDARLHKNSFWKALSESPQTFQTKKGNWLKPIDDIVDSYWVFRTVERDVEEL
jgi:hypothetical protein